MGVIARSEIAPVALWGIVTLNLKKAADCREKAKTDPAQADYRTDQAINWLQRAIQNGDQSSLSARHCGEPFASNGAVRRVARWTAGTKTTARSPMFWFDGQMLMTVGIDKLWSSDMLVRPAIWPNGCLARGSWRYARCPLTRLAAKPAKLSVSLRGVVSRQPLRTGDNFPTVRLNSRSGIFCRFGLKR
jgi:hypothetical protein